jgi:hypothetical protein
VALPCRLALGDEVLGNLGLALHQASPGSWYMRPHLLAGRQALAHDRDELSLIPTVGRHMVRSPTGRGSRGEGIGSDDENGGIAGAGGW